VINVNFFPILRHSNKASFKICNFLNQVIRTTTPAKVRKPGILQISVALCFVSVNTGDRILSRKRW